MNQQTDRLNTALAGRYRIERHLGEGGMASVYLCEDLKHDRKVALKLLKPELAAVLGADRFVVEIKTTASLQHPHILPLFDSGVADGFLFYVMPFIDGETLRAKLDHETQLGVDEAVRVAREVLDALQYAHEHGIVHRDVKPENILLHGGHAMVADFGIALAVSAAAGGRMTETGLSLGTPHYMSPEQATAEKEITARSDVYSLGCVLYEMIAGNPPHTGAAAQQIIMKIITEPAEPVTKHRRSVPPNVAAAVAHALEKLPADRFESAKAFGEALGNASYTSSSVGASATASDVRGGRRGVSSRAFAITVAALATALVVTAAWGWRASRPAPHPPASRFALGLPEGVTLFVGGGTKLALSKDGSRLVLVGIKDGKRALYLRRIDDPVAQAIRGGELGSGTGATNVSPTFSPAGDWIVFEDDRVPKKIPTAGGTAQTLADTGGGVSWGEGNVLAYSRRANLWVGTPEGHDARLVARADTAHGVFSLEWPEVLPGGEHALLTLNRAPGAGLVVDSMRLGVVSLRTGAVTDLGLYGTNPHYVSTGHVVFGRVNGLVFVAPFSLRTRRVTGQASLLLQGVWQGTGGATGFSVSDNGVLAYHEGTQRNEKELLAVNRSGGVRRVPGDPSDFSSPRVSPDGRRIAATLRYSNGKFGTSLIDVGTGQHELLAAADSGRNPEWSRDGARVVLWRSGAAGGEYVSRAPDRSRADSVLIRGVSGGDLVPGIPHGLAAVSRVPSTGEKSPGVYVTPMDSMGAMRPFAVGTSNNDSPGISGDGRLLAWVSDESRLKEVYVQPLAGGARVQVSVQGGSEPAWSREGATLYYRGPARMMLAEIGGIPLKVMRRDSLFEDPFLRVTRGGRYWDVFPGAKEFLMVRQVTTSKSAVFVVVNWQQLQAATGAPAAAGR